MYLTDKEMRGLNAFCISQEVDFGGANRVYAPNFEHRYYLSLGEFRHIGHRDPEFRGILSSLVRKGLLVVVDQSYELCDDLSISALRRSSDSFAAPPMYTVNWYGLTRKGIALLPLKTS